MAGSRPSQFRKGGGFLHGTDLVIRDIVFTDVLPNGQPFVPGKDPKDPKKDKFHSLFARLTVRVDGADADVSTSLFVGNADDYAITDNGHTIEGPDLGVSALTKFIGSLVTAGFPDTNLPEDKINFTSVIGARVRTIQQTDAERTKKIGKRKGKDGREYDQKDLLVDQFYGMVGGAQVPAGSSTAAASSAAPAAPAGNVGDAAATLLMDILAKAKDNKIAKAKLNSAIVGATVGNPQREALRKYLLEDANLQAIEGVTFDGTTISL